MVRLRTWLHWLDENLLLVFATFLIAFIPLFPKIPLFSPIEQYIVRVRLEDILILLATLLWFVQVLRRKISWKTPLTKWILAYEIAATLSVLSALFLTKSVPLQPLHMAKTLLHYFRYIEYFSLFFIVFSSIKKRSHAWLMLIVLTLTLISVSFYGYGQKFWYWPVYSTMNREFSKGLRLYLTPHARVQSTFAGHYDMAAWLVVVLPLLISLAFLVKGKKWKLLFHIAFWSGTWLIIVSASRTSFLAYLAGLGVTILLLAGLRDRWRDKISFALSRGFIILLVTAVMFATFGEDLQERLSQVIDSNQQWHDAFHTLNKQRKEFLANGLSFGFGKVEPPKPPENAISTDEAIAQGVLTPSDETPVVTRPRDVYKDIPDIVTVATVSASGSATTIQQEAPRVFSACALDKGLSLCIRLETLWPRAIKGFMRNPVFGTGYATLNKENDYQFTEAESTDNNFLRTLGETGLAGFITFYGCVMVLIWNAVRQLRQKDWLKLALSVAMIGGSVGLLLNAVYIDVFASSKVALTYWGLGGLFCAVMLMKDELMVVEPAVKTVTSNVQSTPKKSRPRKLAKGS